MNWLKRLLGSAAALLSQYFRSGRAAEDAKWALEHVAEALPYIAKVAPIVVGLTPTTIDDQAWAYIRGRYPQFFDGSLHTAEELKAAALIAAAELFGRAVSADTSRARAAVQLAYLEYRNAPAAPK